MNLLITGGCGFLGCNLARHTLQNGHTLVVLDNLSRPGAEQNLAWLRSQGNFNFVHGDVRDVEGVARVVREFRPDCVFHLAGQVAMTVSIENPRMDFEINAVGTLNVLEALRRWSPESVVIYSSTNKVYGDLEQYHYDESATRFLCIDRPDGFDESTPLAFHSPYGCSKGAGDQYMLDYARIYGLRTVVLRHSSMYGGRQFATHDQGWIGWFCGRALALRAGDEQAFTICGSGKQVRDVLHVDDLLRLYFTLVEHIEGVRGQVFNIGGGMENSLSLLELFSFLERETCAKMRFTRLEPRQSDQRVFVADISRITQSTGWYPRIDWITGVRAMLSWLQERP